MAEDLVDAASDGTNVVPSEESKAVTDEPLEGSRPKAFKIERARDRGKRKWLSRLAVKRPAGIRMDFLCMISAMLGLMSLALPWVVEQTYTQEYRTLWSYAVDNEGEGLDVFGLAAGFMLIGSLLALFTRLGGLVQMGGLICFLIVPKTSTSDFSIGFYFALVGCVAGILSLVLRRSYPIPQRFYTLNLLAHPNRLEINLLSILGGAIGLMCLVLPWFEAHWRYFPYYDDTNQFTLFQFSSMYLGSVLTWIAGVVFVAGSIVALFSPLGAIGQFAGWGVFLYDLRGFAAYAEDHYGHYFSPTAETSFSIGFFLGLVSALIVLVSLFIPWRLRLSRRAVSWFIAWPVGLVSPAAEPETPKPGASEAYNFKQVLKSTMKALIITIVILAIIVSSAGLAYVMPLSTVEVSVGSNYPNQRLHIAIYLDSEFKLVDYVDEGTSLQESFSVRAGIHRVAFDYGVVGDENGSQVDGVPDWAASIKVKPLRVSRLGVSLGFSYEQRPVIDLTSSPYGNGERVNMTDVNEGTYSDVYWEDMRIMLRDGSNTAQWRPSSGDLDNGTYTEHSFLPVSLGQLNVTCTIVDLFGNGFVNAGDSITFTTDSGPAFSSAATYTLYVLDESYGSLVAELSFQGRY